MYHSRNRMPRGLTPADVNIMDSFPKPALYRVALELAGGDSAKLVDTWRELHAAGTIPAPPKGAAL